MNARNFKCRFVIYGSFNKVELTTENVQFFVQHFVPESFLPTQSQEIKIEVSPKGMQQQKVHNLSLTSLDNKWRIKFSNESISSVYIFNSNADIDMNTFIQKSKEYLTILKEKLSIHKISRFGFVIEQIIQTESDILSNYRKIITKKADSQLPFEWQYRVTERKNIPSLKENVNFVYSNNYVNGSIQTPEGAQQFKGVHLLYDVNSLPEIKNGRFELEDISTYLNESKSLIENFISSQK